MAKADINLPDGTKITVDGSEEEIEKILDWLKSGRPSASSSAKKSSPLQFKKKSGAKEYIRELIAEGYFKEKRSLGDVQETLEEHGFIYETTSLSKPLLELVQVKELGRVKQDSNWLYFCRD